MADTSASVAKSAKSPKRKAAGKPKAAPSHPTYASMITKAITSLKEKKGSSRANILKYILSNYKVGTDARAVNGRLRIALHRALDKGVIRHAKGGMGASGSFKLTDKKEKTVKKPRATKPKSPAKKATKAKKVTSPKKVKTSKPKSPKKVKKTPTKKTAKPKKKASPKKKIAKK